MHKKGYFSFLRMARIILNKIDMAHATTPTLASKAKMPTNISNDDTIHIAINAKNRKKAHVRHPLVHLAFIESVGSLSNMFNNPSFLVY